MAAEIICDGCGKRAPMGVSADSHHIKPHEWYERTEFATNADGIRTVGRNACGPRAAASASNSQEKSMDSPQPSCPSDPTPATVVGKVKDSLGDRMKANYEDRARHYLTRRTPVIVRVDGKAFHTFTRPFDRPFSGIIMDAMQSAAARVCDEMQGCKLAYVQSDEASFLLTDYDQLQTGAWFDYNKAKMESVAASCMTAWFNHRLVGSTAMFDARAFNIPREEIANYFLWRAKDWERNSVSMYAQAHFSPKQLHGKGRADQHDMLHSIGKNWATDLDERCRNGTWIWRADGGWKASHATQPLYAEVSALVEQATRPGDAAGGGQQA